MNENGEPYTGAEEEREDPALLEDADAADDGPVHVMAIDDDPADVVIPNRLRKYATDIRGFMGISSFLDLNDAGDSELHGEYEIWYYGKLEIGLASDLQEEDDPDEGAGEEDDTEEDALRVAITDGEWPALLVARHVKTGQDVLLHDNARHGIDAMLYGVPQPGPDDRPLTMLELPSTRVVMQFLYNVDVSDAHEWLETDENGLLITMDDSHRTWADIASDAYGYVAIRLEYEEMDLEIYAQDTGTRVPD